VLRRSWFTQGYQRGLWRYPADCDKLIERSSVRYSNSAGLWAIQNCMKMNVGGNIMVLDYFRVMLHPNVSFKARGAQIARQQCLIGIHLNHI